MRSAQLFNFLNSTDAGTAFDVGIPVEEEVAEIVPMCFKRALLESDEEWSTHQKVLDTSSKSIRNTIPVGFPYFHVEWGGKYV